MKIELSDDESKHARKLINNHKAMRRYGKPLCLTLLVVFIFYALLTCFSFVMIIRLNDADRQLTDTYSSESNATGNIKHYVDRKSELTYLRLKHLYKLGFNTVISMILLAAIAAIWRLQKVEPLQVKLYRSALEQNTEQERQRHGVP